MSDESPTLRRDRRTTVSEGLEAFIKPNQDKLRRRTINVVNPNDPASPPSSNNSTALNQGSRSDINPETRSVTPAPVPPLPQWKTILDIRVEKDVNTLFQFLLTDGHFYRSWLEERKNENINNVVVSDWVETEDNKIIRTITYEVTKNFGITTATIKVNQKYNQLDYCSPGEVFGVDIDTINTGIAYADSFILHEHYRLTAYDDKSTRFQVVTDIEFTKSTFLKSKIESETWSGYKKSMAVLETLLENLNPKPTKSAKQKKMKSRKGLDVVDRQSPPPPPIQTTSLLELWRLAHSLIMILILTLFAMAVFKISYTLESIDRRLSNIEKAFLYKE